MDGGFAAMNNPFLESIRQQAISYFSCYHWGRPYLDLESYPAFGILNAMQRRGRRRAYSRRR